MIVALMYWIFENFSVPAKAEMSITEIIFEDFIRAWIGYETYFKAAFEPNIDKE